MANILVVDTVKGVRKNLKERLEYEGYAVYDAENAATAIGGHSSVKFDLIICGDGCVPIRTAVPWIAISDEKDTDAVVKIMRDGASDFISKPINMNRLLDSVKSVLESQIKKEEDMRVMTPVQIKQSSCIIKGIIGESQPILRVKKLINLVAPSDARVLITGANGTGKELVARWLHELSRRSNGPFVEVNCAAIPSELIESELFGHEKGAFTSAIKQRKGKFEQANGGTLFLDEVGDMSLSAQAKVLRALQENKISRVGSDKDIAVNVRVVAATNKNLLREIDRNTFREDLYHRLSVIVINVPALSQRRSDIPLLIESFASEICNEYGIPVKVFDRKAISVLSELPWTGNVRELHNVVERLIILSGDVINTQDVDTYAHGTF